MALDGKVKAMKLKTTLIDAIESMAKKENRSFSNMVETMLIQYVNERNKNHEI